MTASYLFANNFLIETTLTPNALSLTALEQALILVQKQLIIFASDSAFDNKMQMSFGTDINTNELQGKWQTGDLSGFPTIEIISATELNGANGAYALINNRIYLSEQYLSQNQGNLGAIASVILEEYGHSVDVVLNSIDAPGDEGAIFSALVQGESLSNQQLAKLKTENDHQELTINGQTISVEMSISDPPNWIKQFGSSSPFEDSWGIAIDSNGNTYAVGNTNGDGRLVKYDNNGKKQWVETISSPENYYDDANDVAVDKDNFIYVLGTTRGEFENGVLENDYDGYLAKYDSNQNRIWIKQISGPGTEDGRAIAIDDNGFIYLTGITTGNFGGVSKGSFDVWLAKYDREGNQIWVRQFGSNGWGDDQTQGIAVDKNGNIYLTGYTNGNFNENQTNSIGVYDAWVAKYNSDGVQQWKNPVQFGTNQNDLSYDIAVDNDGFIYLTGSTGGQLGDISYGGSDGWVAKYNSNGERTWLKQFGTDYGEASQGITIGSNGKIYLTGNTTGNFGDKTTFGGSDVWIAQYDSSGQKNWITQFGSGSLDYSYDIVTDTSNNLYLTGITTGTFPGETNQGGNDGWVAKYVTAETTVTIKTIKGKVEWTDFKGNKHPVRGATVQILDVATGKRLVPIEPVYTNEKGQYTATFDNNNTIVQTNRDINIEVLADGHIDGQRTHYITNPDKTIPTYYYSINKKLDISGSIPDIIIGNSSDAERAFYINDILYVGALYAKEVRGKVPKAELTTTFPNDRPEAYWDDRNLLEIGIRLLDPNRSNNNPWRTILHEYGHFLADIDVDHLYYLDEKGAAINEEHSEGTSKINTLGKIKGVRLAWQEGLATYISGAARKVVKDNELLPNAPNTDDYTYLESNTPTVSIGEGDELSTTRILWDIADDNSDTFASGLKDEIAIGHKNLYNIIDNIPNIEKVADIWNYFSGNDKSNNLDKLNLGTIEDDAKRAKLGAIFEEYGISPSIESLNQDWIGYVNNTNMNGTWEPSITWKLGNNNANDEFEVIVFNQDFSRRLIGTSLLKVDNTDTKITWKPELDTKYGDYTWRELYKNPGEYHIVIIGIDTDGGFKTGPYWSGAYTFTINNANNAPVIQNAIADQNAKQGTAFNFQIPTNTFTDIDAGDVLTYSATLENGDLLPSWLTFDPSTQTFSGTPTNDNVGNLNIKVAATDKVGATVSDIFTITVENVNDAPILQNPIADRKVKPGKEQIFNIPGNTFIDIDAGDVLTYSATLENGDPLPSWLIFDPSTQAFFGTPTNDNVGNLNVKAIATDKAGASVSDIFTITVENVNDAPTLQNTIADLNTKQGNTLTFQIPPNTFSVLDPNNVLSYSATLDNGSPLPNWLTFDTQSLTFSGNPINDNVGSLNIKVTVKDSNGTSVSDTFALTIENINDAPTLQNVIVDQNAKQGTAFNFQIPSNTFIDIDADDVLTYSATLENGNALPSWLTFNPSTQTFSGTPTNDNVGNLNVKVAATDKAGETVSDIFTITVENVNDAPTLQNAIVDQKAKQGTAFNFQIPSNTFTDIDAGDVLTYSATVENSNALPSWLTFNPTTRTFSGTPTNDNVGNLNVKAIATDKAGATVSDIFTIAVENINDTPILQKAISDQTAKANKLFQFTLPQQTFIDTDVGDTLTYTYTTANNDNLIQNGGFEVGNVASNFDFISLNVNSKAIANWNVTRAQIDYYQNGWVAANGKRSLDLNGSPGVGGIAQTFNTKIGQQYVVNFALAGHVSGLLQTIGISAAGQSTTFQFQSGQNPNNLGWTTKSWSFTANAATTTLEFYSLQTGYPFGGPALDNVSVFAVVTPPTWLTFNPATQTFSGTPTDQDVGKVYDIKVTATDTQGASVSDDFTINVNNDLAPFQYYLNQTGTALHETSSNFEFEFTDWNGDGKQDLVAIKKSATGTNSTEIHILSGASNFQQSLLDTGTKFEETGSNFEFEFTDWNGDGKQDLVAIKKSATGTNSTEVHILSGASNFQQSLLDTGTALHETGSNFEFALADWNGDGKQDLVAIKKSATGTNSTEVHILSGASNFQQSLLDIGTKFEETGSNFEFALADWNGDGKQDLVAIKKSATGTNSTEVHILSGASNFQQSLLDIGTKLHETDSNFEFALADWNGDGKQDLVAIKKSGTATNSIEIHILSGAVSITQPNQTPILKQAIPSTSGAIADQNAKQGTAFNFQIPSNTFIDIDAGDVLTYSATLENGDALPSWLTFNPNTQTFTGTPTNDNVGNLNVKAIATDKAGETVSDIFTITVENVNDAPTLTNAIPDQIAKQDIEFSFTFDANTFIDIDSEDNLSYSATLQDGSNLPNWLKFNAATRTFSGIATKTDLASLIIKVLATDNRGLSAIDTFALAVQQNNSTPTFKLAKIADDIFNISNSSGKSKIKVTLTERNSNLVNELGVFTVDDAQGKINGIAPGTAGYIQAALERSQVIFSAISNLPNGFNTDNLTHLLEFNSGENLRFYLVKNSTIDAVRTGITPLTDILFSDPLTQKITDLGNDEFSLAWKDGSGNNAANFNNLVVKFSSINDSLPLGTNLQGKPQGEVIDLRGITSQVKADFVINREAAFNNFIGFYQVADENGGIDSNGDGKADIFAGQAGYIEAAIRGRVAGIDLTVNNQGTASYTGTFQPGTIFAPFIIANGRPDALLDSNPNNNPAVYFPYIGANADKVDHIRLLGNNIFGFEDLPTGGDKDFNDVIVRVNLSIV